MFKKLLILFYLLFNFIAAGFAYSEDNLSALELAKYGMDYPDESLGERLNRLETDYFGMSQTGDIETRLANLSQMGANSQNSTNLPVYENYYNNSKPKSKLRNFWDNISSGLFNNGYMTGFTPSMNTMTTSGISDENNFYRNNLYNSVNPSAICPYGNGYHNRSAIDRHRYYNRRHPSSFNGVNRFVPNLSRRTIPAPLSRDYHPYYGQNYNGFNNPRPHTWRSEYYLPPNVETKSSIHILRD